MNAADRVELTYRRALEVLPPGLRPWYRTERQRIHRMADARMVDRTAALNAASALSPRLPWDRVVTVYLRALLQDDPRPAGIFKACWRKARRALQGDDLDALFPRATAPKTRAFAQALAGEPVPVVDVWAGRVALGYHPRTLGQYRLAEEAYYEVSDRFGIRPDRLQAEVWVAVRDLDVPIPEGQVG